MNGRTAQESRLPVNGTAAANGTNGHGPQPEPHAGQAAPADQGEERAEHEPGAQASEQAPKTPAWVEEFKFQGDRVTYDDIVVGRAPRPRVAKLIDQRMRTRRRFWKPMR